MFLANIFNSEITLNMVYIDIFIFVNSEITLNMVNIDINVIIK